MALRFGIPYTVFLLLLYIFFSSTAASAGKDQIDIGEIKRQLDTIHSASGRISYLESISSDDHFVLYTLATFHLELDHVDEAEKLLLMDIHRNRDVYDRYESTALLFGLLLDQNRSIPRSDIVRYSRVVGAMKSRAQKDIHRVSDMEKRRIEIFSKDPYQLERMLGDYHYLRKDYNAAFAWYSRFYADLDKPLDSFVPESMRRFARMLLNRGEIDDALHFLGYLVNVRPYMFEDFSIIYEVYDSYHDPVNAVLVAMTMNTLAEGYSNYWYDKSLRLIRRKIDSVKDVPEIARLIDVFFSGEQVESVPSLVAGLRKRGYNNFYLYYLSGLAFFMKGQFEEALVQFDAFNGVYPYLADSHYYRIVCMKHLGNGNTQHFSDSAERVVMLKPRSTIALLTKLRIGEKLGISEEDSRYLLLISEVEYLLNNFTQLGAPVESLDPLIIALALSSNPYQAAQINLMSRVTNRIEEYKTYLMIKRDSLSGRARTNLERVLFRLKNPAP